MRVLPGCLSIHHYAIFAVFLFASFGFCSDVSFEVGSGAASQLIREGLHQVLREPNAAQLSIQTNANPWLPSLAKINAESRLYFGNVSFKFEPNLVRINANNVRIHSISTITPNFWPMSFSDEIVHLNVQLGEVEFATSVYDNTFTTQLCRFQDTNLQVSSSHYWLLDSLLSVASRPLQGYLDYLICPIFADYASSIQYSTANNISLSEIIPPPYRQYLNNTNAGLFYRVRAVEVQERHAHVTAQLEWDRDNLGDCNWRNNGSLLNIHWDNDERVAFMVEDTAVNELLEQVDWSFQWMDEQIGVTSHALPASSRLFLQTLCISCYFRLKVWANGPPIIRATNGSITLEKRDRINLRVVNPDRNATSVFVAMTLFIHAELRPVVDSGTVRTMVQLLDTNVTMEEGAYPPVWTSFLQDLVRGMILDVMWPDLKQKIEGLTYGQGIGLASSCGVDMSTAKILIEEGQFGATVTLALSNLEPEKCVKDLKASLPDTSELFEQD